MAKSKNVAASVHQRLLNQARSTNRPFMELLQYYAMERFLLRMSKSKYTESFILKGALLLRVAGIGEVRPTRDIDFLGKAGEDIGKLEQIISECCTIDVEDDGLEFHASSVSGVEIRENQAYQGVRITFNGTLGTAKVSMQIDIGFGDVVSPKPLLVEYPVLLEGEAPQLYAYTLESAIAEKYQAMVALDMANSRMKDFFDIWFLSKNHSFSAEQLSEAVRQTFSRRKTALPKELPTALTEVFFENPAKKNQWQSYRKKVEDSSSPETLEEVVSDIITFIWPVNEHLIGAKTNLKKWLLGGGWKYEERSQP